MVLNGKGPTDGYKRSFVFSVSVFRFTLGKPDVRLEMHAGNCTVWNTGSNQMARCQVTRPLGEGTIPSTPSSVRQVLASMSLELSSSIWSQL